MINSKAYSIENEYNLELVKLNYFFKPQNPKT